MHFSHKGKLEHFLCEEGSKGYLMAAWASGIWNRQSKISYFLLSLSSWTSLWRSLKPGMGKLNISAHLDFFLMFPRQVRRVRQKPKGAACQPWQYADLRTSNYFFFFFFKYSLLALTLMLWSGLQSIRIYIYTHIHTYLSTYTYRYISSEQISIYKVWH